MGRYVEETRHVSIPPVVNACQTWSNDQAFRHGFHEAKVLCGSVALEADEEIAELRDAVQGLLTAIRASNVSNGATRKAEQKAHEVLEKNRQ